MSLEPVIFDSPRELEEAIDVAVGVLRLSDAEKFRALADDYESQALSEPQFSYAAGELEGIAGGLGIAAALLENQAEVPA